MNNIFITTNSAQTRKLGETLAKELKGGKIICLTGELGSGKTTFAQGVLRGLGAKGHYTSPTFLVMKHYKKEIPNPKSQIPNKYQNSKIKTARQNSKVKNIFHLDCYRVKPKDILDLGWEEIIADKNNIVIIEWAERIKKIIPKNAAWVEFEHLDGDERKIIFKSKFQNQNDKSNSKLK